LWSEVEPELAAAHPMGP